MLLDTHGLGVLDELLSALPEDVTSCLCDDDIDFISSNFSINCTALNTSQTRLNRHSSQG